MDKKKIYIKGEAEIKSCGIPTTYAYELYEVATDSGVDVCCERGTTDNGGDVIVYYKLVEGYVEKEMEDVADWGRYWIIKDNEIIGDNNDYILIQQ